MLLVVVVVVVISFVCMCVCEYECVSVIQDDSLRLRVFFSV